MSIPTNLGRVGMVLKGTYSAATQYKYLDVVTYANGAFAAKRDTQGNLPTNATYWMPLVDTASCNTATENANTAASNANSAASAAIAATADIADTEKSLDVILSVFGARLRLLETEVATLRAQVNALV